MSRRGEAMGKIDYKVAWQVAVTYIGTVVGAGFASGQEILQFFSRYGERALWGLGLATLLFFWCGDFVMRLGRSRDASTFKAVADHLFGVKLGRMVHIGLLIMLFGVTVAMLAGSGALFAEQVGLPFVVGAILCALLTVVTLIGGLQGLMTANLVIVPLMMGFIAFAFLYGLLWRHAAVLQTVLPVHGAPLAPGGWILSAALYVGFNMGLSVTVLIPLGRISMTRSTLATGAFLGALGLGAMLFMLHLLLASFYPILSGYEIPIGQLITVLSKTLPGGALTSWLLRVGFVAVLWGEIFSTLLSNVYGLSAELSGVFGRTQMVRIVVILTAAFAFCQIGFAHLVSYTYPIFGYAGLLLLILAIIRDRPSLRV